MAQLITARLSRTDAQPWGFRLQGGKDFGTPLTIQKVNTGSIADKAGLQAGDAVVRINNVDLFNLRHKEAQDAIVRAGTSFEFVVQRGGGVWRPCVTPVGSIKSPTPTMGNNIAPVTKTSLAANQHPIPASPVKSIVNKQYNSPVAMYSDTAIAETLSAQAEVLAGGVLGVNFKKNERVYQPEKSEVLKMLQENDADPEPGNESEYYKASSHFYWRQSHAIGGSATSSPRPITPSYQNVPDARIGTPLQQSVLAPNASHRPSLPMQQPKQHTSVSQSTLPKPTPIIKPVPSIPPPSLISSTTTNSSATTTSFQSEFKSEKSVGANTISSALNAHASNLNGNVNSSSMSGPKPFGYSQPAPAPAPMAPMSAAGPKSPSSYPPAQPAAPTWAPSGVATPPKPAVQNVQASPIKKPGFNAKGSAGTPGAVPKHGRTFTSTGPTRGQGVLTQPTAGGRIPICGSCGTQIRGPFITALGRTWCPEHFICVNANCKRELADIGFVEEKGDLYCEYCFEQFLAPPCCKCNGKIKGECLNAIGKKFHPQCFTCTYCGKLFGNNPFFLEEGEPYCETDWNELFTTKCFACGFPVEAGDRWVEALNNNYHSQCFNCTFCKKNLEGQSFFAKGGRPFCKNHAR